MAQVKFYRGSINNYSPSTTHKDAIFFVTDENKLLLNNVSYGVSTSDAAILANAVTGVEWVSPYEIKFTCGNGSEYYTITFAEATSSQAGLMGTAHVSKLATIEEGAQVNVIENVVVDGETGTVSGKTLTINGGFAKAADVYTKTEAESMVDAISDNADAIAAEVSRATTKEAELESAIGVNTRDITTLNGEADVQGSVKNIVVQAVSEVVAEAPEAFDTLKEIADYIASDKTGAAEMSNAIAANKKAIEDEVARALEAENSLRTDLNSEIERATLKETELDSAIKDEVDRATAVEETLDTKIDGEVSRATAKETELEGLISTEATTARAAEKANADAIAAEKKRAEGIENALRTDLGQSGAAAGTGSAFARIKQLEEDITSLTGGSDSVATQINNAISGLKGDATATGDTLGKLEDLIENEVSRATKAEGDNTRAIEAEVTRATGKEARIEGLVTAEKNRAEGIEAGLESRLATAEGTLTKLEGADTVAGSIKKQIKDAVQVETDRATGVETGLDNRLKALESSVGEGGDVAGDIADNKAAIEAIQKDYLKTADKTELQGNIDTVADNLASHVADNVRHITTAEREAWNAAEGNAKAYADGLAKNYDAAGSAAAVDEKLTAEINRAKAAEKTNADAISALTKTVNDNETDIEGKMTTLAGRVTTAEETIEGHTTSIGNNAAAITALQNNTVNGKKISTNPVLAGEDIALTNYSADATNGFITATDTVNAAISKLENNLIWHEVL